MDSLNSRREQQLLLDSSSVSLNPDSTCSDPIPSDRSSHGTKKLSAHFCEYSDSTKGQCKQRAINGYSFCIRHILFDPNAPYKQCQHKRKPKNKHDESVLCTNAIRSTSSEIYCSTHLIMNGMKDPKASASSKKAEQKQNNGSKTSTKVANIAEMQGKAAAGVESSSPSQQVGGVQSSPKLRPNFIESQSSLIEKTNNAPANTSFFPRDREPAAPLWLNQQQHSQNRQLEFAEKIKSDALYPLADRLLKSPTRPINEPSSISEESFACFRGLPSNLRKLDNELGTSNDISAFENSSQLSTLCISKTYPQLSAKLMHPKPPQKSAVNSNRYKEADVCENSTLIIPKYVELGMENKLKASERGFITSSHAFGAPYPDKHSSLLISDVPRTSQQQQQQQPPADVVAAAAVAINEGGNNIIPAQSAFLPSPIYFVNCEKLPRHYDLDRLEEKISSVEIVDENELLKFQRDYSNDFDNADSTLTKRKQKVIKLRQKRQKVRIDGVFRKLRAVDTMCRVIENYDFERTDLFPLGLEPSDDDYSSDDSFPSFDERPLIFPESSQTINNNNNCNNNKNNPLTDKHTQNRVELYLLKKKLRLESARLVNKAKICIPINSAAKQHANYTGAALRTRKANKGRGNFTGKISESRFQRCAQMLQHQIVRDGKKHLVNARCSNFCLPWTRHCADHITYNVEQKLFSYCKWRLCNATLPVTDAILFEGLCRRHHLERQRIDLIQSSTHVQKVESPVAATAGRNHHPSFPSTSSNPRKYSSADNNNNSSHGMLDVYPGASANKDEHLNVVDGDVSLASVAKDLGFDGRELTDILERLPVEEAFEGGGEMEADDENLLSGMNKDDSDEVPPGISLGHSWADVEQFLLEQEQQSISDESAPQF